MSAPTEHPHRRHDPLRDEWVLVSPHRNERPWKGEVSPPPSAERPTYDPGCYLCPGNERAGGPINPDYTGTWAFDNDYPALLRESIETPAETANPLLRWSHQSGTARVLVYSPDHSKTPALLGADGLRPVVDLWADQIDELGPAHRWVQVFANQGSAMGASNPHPHGQVWASEHLPTLAATEDRTQRDWLEATGSRMLSDYVATEADSGDRTVVENRCWLVVVPYWASWPFETLVLPKHPWTRLTDIDDVGRDDLASGLAELLAIYDRLFDVPFPYSMGWHGAPTGPDAVESAHWLLHAHFYPPLLRSASVRKHMVGYEMLGEPQRDLTPETAAERLRSLA